MRCSTPRSDAPSLSKPAAPSPKRPALFPGSPPLTPPFPSPKRLAPLPGAPLPSRFPAASAGTASQAPLPKRLAPLPGNLDLAEYRADLALRIEGPRGRLLHQLIVEVQLSPDAAKRYSWPLYVTEGRARLRCPVTLMVVTLTRRMARWCARPISLDQVGNTYQPLVVGPEVIPVIMDLDAGRACPELAVLSAGAHGRETGAEHIALAAFAGCQTLDKDRASLYADFIMAHLGKGARHALEALMHLEGYEYQSDFARKYVQQGREEGLAAMQVMLTRQLEQRFGPLPATAVAAIRAAPLPQVMRWGERVLVASSVDEVLDTSL